MASRTRARSASWLPLDDAPSEPAAFDHELHRPRVATAPPPGHAMLAACQMIGWPGPRRRAASFHFAGCSALRQPGQSVGQPHLRLRAIGQRNDLCRRQRVAVVVQAANARQRQHDLGLRQQAGLLRGTRDAGATQARRRCRSPCRWHARGSRCRPAASSRSCSRFGSDHLHPVCNEARDAGRQGQMGLALVLADQAPVRYRDGPVESPAVLAGASRPPVDPRERIAEDLVHELHQCRSRPP